MDCEPGLARTASVPFTRVRHHAADHDRLRSRSRPPGEHCAVRTSRAVGAGDLRSFWPAEFCQNLWIEGPADLCPAEHEDELRRNQAIRARDCAAAGK